MSQPALSSPTDTSAPAVPAASLATASTTTTATTAAMTSTSEQDNKKVDSGLNLFVANLSVDVDDELFSKTFTSIGPVLSAKVMLDIHTGISRGFGFVMYEKEEDGLKAIFELQGKPLGSRDNPLVITRAQTSAKNAIAATPKIHLRNVPLGVTEATLQDLLSEFGKVERMVIKEDKSGAPATGRTWIPTTLCVFVQFSSSAQAQTAVDKLHNRKPWPEMVVPLMAKLAETPEMRTQRKQRMEGKGKSPTASAGSTNAANTVPPGLPPGTAAPPGMVGASTPHVLQAPHQQQQAGVAMPPGAQPMQPMPMPGVPQMGAAPPIGQFFMQPPPPGQQQNMMENSLEYSLTSSFGSSWNFSQQLPPGMYLPTPPPQPQGAPLPPVAAQQATPPFFQPPPHAPAGGAVKAPPPGYPAGSVPPPAPVPAHLQQPLVPMMGPMGASTLSTPPQMPPPPPQAQPHILTSPTGVPPTLIQPAAATTPPASNASPARPSSPLVPALVPPVVNSVFEQSLEELSGSNHQLSISPGSTGGAALRGSTSGMLLQHVNSPPAAAAVAAGSTPPQYVVLLDPQQGRR